jgi:hypothetical protein
MGAGRRRRYAERESQRRHPPFASATAQELVLLCGLTLPRAPLGGKVRRRDGGQEALQIVAKAANRKAIL